MDRIYTKMGNRESKIQQLRDEIINLDKKHNNLNRQSSDIKTQIDKKNRELLLLEENPSKKLFDHYCNLIENCTIESQLFIDLKQQFKTSNKIILFHDILGEIETFDRNNNILLDLFQDLKISCDDVCNDCPYMETYRYDIENELLSEYKLIAYRERASFIPLIDMYYFPSFVVKIVKKLRYFDY